MGIINVTSDSFSGDGLAHSTDEAVSKALCFLAYGVDIVDIGGESSRPSGIYGNVIAVPEEEEITRVISIIKTIRAVSDVQISIDTYKANVAEEAINAGANMVNNIWGTKRNKKLNEVLANYSVDVVLMHNSANCEYRDVVADSVEQLNLSILDLKNHGVNDSKIIIDPGIGFGKNLTQNLEILNRLDEYRSIGKPILIGTSRKSMIGNILNLPIDERIEGTASTVAVSIIKGANIIRVHDVKEMTRVAKMTDAIVRVGGN
jgi:dihydropteroate synthase